MKLLSSPGHLVMSGLKIVLSIVKCIPQGVNNGISKMQIIGVSATDPSLGNSYGRESLPNAFIPSRKKTIQFKIFQETNGGMKLSVNSGYKNKLNESTIRQTPFSKTTTKRPIYLTRRLTILICTNKYDQQLITYQTGPPSDETAGAGGFERQGE